MRHREFIKKKGLLCSYTGLEVRVKLPRRNRLTPRGALLLHWAAMNTSGHPPLFLPKSFLHTRRPMQEINAPPSPGDTPASSPWMRHLTFRHFVRARRRWAALDRKEWRREKSKQEAMCSLPTADRLDTFCPVSRAAFCSGNRTEGWEEDASCDGVTSSQRWSIRVRAS